MTKRDYRGYKILDEDIIAMEENKPPKIAINEATDYYAETNIIEAQNEEVAILESALIKEKSISQDYDLKEYGLREQVENIQVNNQEDSQESSIFLHQSNKLDIQLEKASAKSQDEEKYLYFPAYKRYYQQKERSALFRWLMLFAKIIITVMLLPLIGFMAVAALCCVGAFGIAIVGCIGIGLIVIGTVAFMSTQISSSAIALGVSVGITSIAFGGVILVIFLMIVRGLKSILKRYKRPHIKMSNKEEVK